jgi:serine protease Do
MKLMIALMLTCATCVSATDDLSLLKSTSRTFARVNRETSPAVVSVKVERMAATSPFGSSDPFDFFFAPPPQQRAPLQGSGFIISEDGYILTNNHVVEKANKIRVSLTDGREFDAEVVGTDPSTDLAVIKLEANELPHLALGDSDAIEVGEWVMAIGNPFGLQGTLTVGVVSAKGRSSVHINELEDFIQTDAAVNPGNSGGPLLNVGGDVIGVNSAIISGTGGYMGIGFAIPSNMAKRVVDQLIHNGSVKRGYLGISLQPVDQELALAFGLSRPVGVLVADVVKGSPADEGGLQQGDIILELDGHRVESIGALRNSISLMDPSSRVQIVINRDGKILTKRIQIGDHPKDSEPEVSAASSMGIEIEPLTPEIAAKFGYHDDSGVIVRDVEPGSAGAAAGLRPGTLIMRVNRESISDPEEFAKAVQEAAKEAPRMLLLVKQGQLIRFLTIRLDDQ